MRNDFLQANTFKNLNTKVFSPCSSGANCSCYRRCFNDKKNPGAPPVNYEKNNIPGDRFMENRYGNITRLNESR